MMRIRTWETVEIELDADDVQRALLAYVRAERVEGIADNSRTTWTWKPGTDGALVLCGALERSL